MQLTLILDDVSFEYIGSIENLVLSIRELTTGKVLNNLTISELETLISFLTLCKDRKYNK